VRREGKRREEKEARREGTRREGQGMKRREEKEFESGDGPSAASARPA
jgi:hypothetical protein